MKTVITSISQALPLLNANNIDLVNFDLQAFYDSDLSKMYFDDFKGEWENQSLWLGGNNGTDYLVLFASQEIMDAPYYKKSHLARMKKYDLLELCHLYGLIAYWEDESNYTKQDLIDELMTVSNEQHYKTHFDETSFHDLDYDSSITGYCQGDKVLIKYIGDDKQFIKGALGYKPCNKYLTNLFYDTPQTVQITCYINDEEYSSDHLTELYDSYDYYDKDKVISLFKQFYSDHAYFKLMLDYLKENLPSELSHL